MISLNTAIAEILWKNKKFFTLFSQKKGRKIHRIRQKIKHKDLVCGKYNINNYRFYCEFLGKSFQYWWVL